MGQQADIHTKILNSRSTDELMGVYDGWAERYDRELIEDWGYSSPERAVNLLAGHIPLATSTVLDAGCGTGLVGVVLADKECPRIDGIDYSAGMLAEAEKKAVYCRLSRMDMNEPLTIDSDCYDGVTCVGTFTSSHVQPQAVNELIRITRSGGALAFTVREDYWHTSDFFGVLVDAHEDGRITVEEIRQEPYIHSEGSSCKLVVLKVC